MLNNANVIQTKYQIRSIVHTGEILFATNVENISATCLKWLYFNFTLQSLPRVYSAVEVEKLVYGNNIGATFEHVRIEQVQDF